MSMSRRYKWWKAESGDPNHICVLIAGRTKRIKLQSKLATGQTDWSFARPGTTHARRDAQ